MPDVLLLGHDGSLLQKLTSTHVPLGIIDLNLSPDDITTLNCESGSQFMIYSDGLSEATNSSGKTLEMDNLLETILPVKAKKRLDKVKETLSIHMGTALHHDDISILLIECTDSTMTSAATNSQSNACSKAGIY